MTEVPPDEFERALRDGRFLDGGAGDEAARLDAQVLRHFCTERAQVDPRGILVRRVVVTGQLDLSGVEVPFPLRFEECAFEQAPVLHGADLRELAFVDCARLPGLLANGIRVHRDLDLSRSTIVGAHRTAASASRRAAVWLCESEIGGRLHALGTRIATDGERALQADRMHVGGPVRMLRGFQARGEVRLVGVHIDGSLHLTGARLESAGPWALDLGHAMIAGTLSLVDEPDGTRCAVHGRINLRSAHVGGQIRVSGADLSDPPAGTAGTAAVVVGAGLSAGGGIVITGSSTCGGPVDLSASDLGGLTVEADCVLAAPGQTALDLTNAELRSGLTIGPDVAIRGTVRLVGAHVRGTVRMAGVRLSEPEGQSLVNADGVRVDGNVDISGLRATGGRLKFWRATIDGGFDATGAWLSNEAECTLRLHQSTIGGSVRLVDDFTSHGYVQLDRSTIAGRLDCGGATLVCAQTGPRNPGGHALQAVATEVHGGMRLGWAHVSPSVDFTDATTTALEDDPTRWPDRFAVTGFRYERFDGRGGADGRSTWNWRLRRRWLRQQAVYDAGPYEQAARVFRQHGYAYGAEQILIAQHTEGRRSIRGHLLLPRSWAHAVYGWSVAYGYRPGRVLWLLALLLLLVTASLYTPMVRSTLRATDEAGDVYGTTGLLVQGSGGPPSGPTDACGYGQVRCFQPVLYAIDTVVPLISLGQRTTWYPDSQSRWGRAVEIWLTGATMAGWFLSSIFLLAFARVARIL